ncbi:hypothetical protein F8538_02695 [Edwardsiella ictaluri]|uniref:hypothetical protein n=1 Tax=Edwardsiella ictaluri TaxID=67780 RepID=UPI0009BF6DD4|nr:hypothetical protein [Edwardsiella ictaluri]ARD40322.1 hypothetical protein B6E78_13915 [Edwardsiella ictaluri]QPW25871.1 hypothetical protein F8538_02695 [Edwardsiella ictaluri]
MRVKQAAQDLQKIAPGALPPSVLITPTQRNGQPVRMFSINGKPLLLAQQDLGIGDNLPLDQVAERIKQRETCAER